MPYILNKTNGVVVATIQDASLDLSTSLTFVGKNYSGYGEVQNENFLRLLENFSNTSAPKKPLEGQIWFDNLNKKMNVYDGSAWKLMGIIEVDSENPGTKKSPTAGDLWFNKREQQLFVYNGLEYVLIGPSTGADTRAQWKGSYEYGDLEGLGTPKYNIKAVVGTNNDVVAIVAAEEITLIEGSDSYALYPNQEKLYRGINLYGADPYSGSSEISGNYFWGTAAHTLNANTATKAESVIFDDLGSSGNYPVVFLNTGTNGVFSPAYIDNAFYYNPSTNTLAADNFDGTLADLAERYESDADYELGSVLVIGGIKEVTVTSIKGNTAVIGPVSKNPAFKMNSEAGPDETHPYIALKGRVPCKVVGRIEKGDLLVTSAYPGYATIYEHADHPSAVFGKALGSQSEGFGVIEVLII
jgi:hypothetical protein